jgi:hypothetical protein
MVGIASLLPKVGGAAVVGGGIAAAPEAEAGIIGVGAKIIKPEAVKLAKDLEAQGYDQRQIWEMTNSTHGTPLYKDADGIWRSEITAENVELQPDAPNRFLQGEIGNAPLNPPLGEVLDYPEMYEAYPDLANIPVARGDTGSEAAYSPPGNLGGERIMLNPETYKEIFEGRRVTPETSENAVRALLHEMQHAIQQREGMSRGTAPMNWKNSGKFMGQLREEIDAIDIEMEGLLKDLNSPEADAAFKNTVEQQFLPGLRARKEIATRMLEISDRLKTRLMGDPRFDNEEEFWKAFSQIVYEMNLGELDARLMMLRRGMSTEDILARPPFEDPRDIRMGRIQQDAGGIKKELSYTERKRLESGEDISLEPRSELFEDDTIPTLTPDAPDTIRRTSPLGRLDNLVKDVKYRLSPFLEPGKQFTDFGARMVLDVLTGIGSGVIGMAGYGTDEDDPLAGIIPTDPEEIEALRERLKGQGDKILPMDRNQYAQSLSSAISGIMDKLSPHLSEAERKIKQSQLYRTLAPYVIQGWEAVPEKEQEFIKSAGEVAESVL